MSLPPPLREAIESALAQPVRGARPVTGGDLNDAWRVELDDGAAAFVKTSAEAPAGGYAAEAEGLRWLAEPRALGVPGVLAVVDLPGGGHAGPRLLALQWIDEGRLDAAGEEALGRGLARLHQAGAPSFGARAPIRFGPLESPTRPPPAGPRSTPSAGCAR